MSQRAIDNMCKITLPSSVWAGSWKGRWTWEIQVLNCEVWWLIPEEKVVFIM